MNTPLFPYHQFNQPINSCVHSFSLSFCSYPEPNSSLLLCIPHFFLLHLRNLPLKLYPLSAVSSGSFNWSIPWAQMLRYLPPYEHEKKQYCLLTLNKLSTYFSVLLTSWNNCQNNHPHFPFTTSLQSTLGSCLHDLSYCPCQCHQEFPCCQK